MITDLDRSKYIGASDMRYVFAKNKTTKSWLEWWGVKCGLSEPSFHGNLATRAGTMFEHRILKAVNEEMNLDRQLIIEDLILRVNYDGDKDGVIYECKTHKIEKPFEISDSYFKQAQCQMLCYQKCMEDFKEHRFVSYALTEEDYELVSAKYDVWLSGDMKDEEIPIDLGRIKVHSPTRYSKSTCRAIEKKLKHLKECMEKGKIPT